MQLRLFHLLLALSGIAAFFSSCNKDFSTDEPFPNSYSPTVFIGSQNQILYALDPETSRKKWELQLSGNIQATPVVMGNNIYVATEDGTIYTIDAKRGNILNSAHLGGKLISSPYCEPGGKDGDDYLYIGTAGLRSFIAYDLTGDSLEWQVFLDNEVFSSPTVYDTLVIFGCYDGKVYAFDKRDGTEIWNFETGGPIYSSPTVKNGHVYIGSQDQNLYSLHAHNGQLAWQFTAGGAILSSPAVHGGNIIFGANDYKVYCIDSISHLPRWVFETEDQVVSSPIGYQEDLVFIGSNDFYIYGINIIDGTLRWRFKTGAIVKSSPMIYDQKLYIGGLDKFMYCLKPETGDLIWRKNINGLIECSPVVDNLDGKSTYTSSISGHSTQ